MQGWYCTETFNTGLIGVEGLILRKLNRGNHKNWIFEKKKKKKIKVTFNIGINHVIDFFVTCQKLPII